ncbi:MAG: DisA protein [Deltaproteobacteria bacterium CG_4_8_14_3_um_filter_51_11]|nr:DisA protein [bacterium]OIP43278.1 MAG: DisA protein [Desulfobacteraceae bacterium CG2_30_51_40]PIP46302.1 MAG: DisA protein [Deltaproteobacteria bacterium CG23_combo_of_CG06-09_8_20_14_all_51_20]PIX18801.1 MAG: DisA protein [Deltaproteobacteria bacterium CG_4_8_14_3_um_filter_51_11]PIY22843.1 MAG: DisA protein [Deltaproteobacteria bacterium CG_4_10_14_3_um_filter_51_14]PJB36020.1 MAG: DisA protein [Deltaproteobacteria bacterium CG_4_9_14_3_um_filter_51_14]
MIAATASFFSAMRWQDVIDILINSYILFRFYVLFRGTNVLRVLVAIGFLWFFQRIATSLGLVVTSWAIQGITAFAALIIIVVFRNEIRSVLQAKNIKNIVWGLPITSVSAPVSIIADSVFDLARSHTGGLLVFPGKEDLGEMVHSGIQWDGKISKEMLMSIFWRDNPVHDGAAIISGDRVSEVGAILPLSHRNDLPSYYGTRHRAAAGLAEATDALIVVVSEERGNVALAKGQRFSVVKNREELSQEIESHLGIASRQNAFLRRRILELGAAAAVSLLFIGGVWFSFTRGLDTLVSLEIPVEYMNRDQNLEIIDTTANAVRLNLSGSGTLIKSIKPDQVRVRIDLGKAVIGHNTFSITQENVSLPPGVFLRKVDPPNLDVTMDNPVKKELPVQVDWVGKMPENLILASARLDPEKIQVVGGSKLLENIVTIYTEKVSLENITKSGKITVKPVLYPASIMIAPGSRERIIVEMEVRSVAPSVK